MYEFEEELYDLSGNVAAAAAAGDTQPYVVVWHSSGYKPSAACLEPLFYHAELL